MHTLLSCLAGRAPFPRLKTAEETQGRPHVISIHNERGGRGTACMVKHEGRHSVVTAAHVSSTPHKHIGTFQLRDDRDTVARANMRYSDYHLHMQRPGRRMDIASLRPERLPPKFRATVLKLAKKLPATGETVWLTGRRGPHQEPVHKPFIWVNDIKNIAFLASPVMPVEELSQEILEGWSIAQGGLSGSPITNRNMELVGVVNTSFYLPNFYNPASKNFFSLSADRVTPRFRPPRPFLWLYYGISTVLPRLPWILRLG